MNDLAPVYHAVGSILKEQRAEIDLAIAEQAEKLKDLLETIRVLDASQAKRADGLRQQLASQAETAMSTLHKLEAKLAALPKPTVPYDDTGLRGELEARLKELRSDLQEAQTGAIEGVANEIKALEIKLAALPKPEIPLPYDDTGLRKELEELRDGLLKTQVATVADVSKHLTAQIKALEGKLADLPEPVSPYDDTDIRMQLETDLKELRYDLQQTQTGVVEGTALVTSQIKALENKLAALPEPVSPYDDTAVCQKLDELTESVLELYQQPEVLRGLRGELDTLRQQFDTMPLQFDERRAKAETELRHAIEVMELRIGKQLAELERRPGKKGDPGIGLPGRDGLGVDVKIWTPGIHREGEVVQYAMGKIARAKRDTVTKPDNRNDWERVGTAGFELKGIKQADAVYEDGDLYMDDGTMFCWWNGKGKMFARRGRDGKDGKDGKDAKKAKDGVDGPQPLEIRGYADGFSLVYDNGTVLDFPVEQFELFMDEWAEKRQKQSESAAAAVTKQSNIAFNLDSRPRSTDVCKVPPIKTLSYLGDITDVTVSPVPIYDGVGIARLVGSGTLTIQPAGVNEYAVYLLRLTSNTDGTNELTVPVGVRWVGGDVVSIAPKTGQAINLLIKSLGGEVILSVTSDVVSE